MWDIFETYLVIRQFNETSVTNEGASRVSNTTLQQNVILPIFEA
jgi:hypothetical protein